MDTKEKDRHFLFGIVTTLGLCLIIFAFFTGDDVCINSKFLNICEWIFYGLISLTVISCIVFLGFGIKANQEEKENKISKWYIVTDCSQDQELRKKKKLLFHQDVRVFSNDILSYCGTVEQVEFAGWDCYFMEGAFEGCANLEYIKLPSKLEKIPDNMFRNCKSLKQITIPATVKSIGKNAFEGCNGLTSVVFEDPTGWHVTKNPTNAKNKTGGKEDKLPIAEIYANLVKRKYNTYYWYKK